MPSEEGKQKAVYEQEQEPHPCEGPLVRKCGCDERQKTNRYARYG